MASRMPIDVIVPGGILATDHVHRVTNDGTCSRCREPVAEDDVPLMLWFGRGGDDLLIYCTRCLHEPEACDA